MAEQKSETRELQDRMALQRAEFDAADEFAKQVQRHNRTPVVDDDYPEVRHHYERALAALLRAMAANGRFKGSNRYSLVETAIKDREGATESLNSAYHRVLRIQCPIPVDPCPRNGRTR